MIRQRPANRRAHEIIAIEHEGLFYRVELGREIVCNGSCGGAPRLSAPCEVFLKASKVDSAIDVLTSDGAILMSMLLQYGCPAADIFHAMKHNGDGSPASPLGRAAAYLVEGEAP